MQGHVCRALAALGVMAAAALTLGAGGTAAWASPARLAVASPALPAVASPARPEVAGPGAARIPPPGVANSRLSAVTAGGLPACFQAGRYGSNHATFRYRRQAGPVGRGLSLFL